MVARRYGFMLSCQKQYLTRSLRSLVRYYFCHSNTKSILSSQPSNILYIYSTICRHACFGVLRLVSEAWYTSRYAWWHPYIYTCSCSHQAHVVQHGPPTHPDMRRVAWGQSAQTTQRRSELCIIAIAWTPINSSTEGSTTPKWGSVLVCWLCIYIYRENNTWCAEIPDLFRVLNMISHEWAQRTSAWDIMFNTRNKSGISAHPCIFLFII
jgi:hypothetical protein